MEPKSWRSSLAETNRRFVSEYNLNSWLRDKKDEKCEAMEKELAAVKARLEETEQELENEKKRTRRLQIKLRKAQKECGKKDEMIEERDREIDLLKRIITMEEMETEEQAERMETEEDQRRDRGSQFDGRFSLSPIPEEDIEQIPGYYDECTKYASSLRIIIGSDSTKDGSKKAPKRKKTEEVLRKVQKESAPKPKKRKYALWFSVGSF